MPMPGAAFSPPSAASFGTFCVKPPTFVPLT